MATIAAISTVLAVLPLIVSAAEHYEDCFRPFVRYRKFNTEVYRFQQRLSIQKTIFRNQCRLLLENVTEHDVAARMLSGPAHPSWSDPKLDRELATLLGSSREDCCNLIASIDDKLHDIDKESQDLGTIMDANPTTESIGDKAWRYRIGKKLRFSFSKSRLGEALTDLKSFNDEFLMLSGQVNALTTSQTRSAWTNVKQHNTDLEKYRVIEKASKQIYDALGRACTKHSEHVAHFCIEVEHQAQYDRQTPQVQFNLAFTNLTLTGSSCQGDPIWFMIDTIIEDSIIHSQTKSADPNKDLAQALKRQLDSSPEVSSKKARKSVRFAVTPSKTPNVPSAVDPSVLLSDPRIRRDFCDYLRSFCRQHSQPNACMGMLDHTDSCKHLVYPSKNQPRSGRATSLEQVISLISQQGLAGGLPQYKKLHLAKSLAIAVLQYHATPWLKVSWRSQDIFFNADESNDTAPSRLNLKAPHLNVRIKTSDQILSQTSTNSTRSIVRNPLLFNLGVMLLEVAYCAPLRSLELPCDLENGERTTLTEVFAARRLAGSLGREIGGTYGKIVKKLLECDFGCGDDLNDPKLQFGFHTDVVCALERLEQGFRQLQVGDGDE